MLHKYVNFVENNLLLEGGHNSSSPEILYWNNQFDEIKNLEWLDFSTSRSSNCYQITFKTTEDEYNYYRVLYDKNLSENPETAD